jgi:hypothetical protein
MQRLPASVRSTLESGRNAERQFWRPDKSAFSEDDEGSLAMLPAERGLQP